MILVSGLSLPFTEDEGAAIAKARRILGMREGEAFIYRRSLDARRRQDIRYQYTVGVSADAAAEEAAAKSGDSRVRLYREEPLTLPHGDRALSCRPVVAGFGPAGMFCALLLARCGYRPLVLERGGPVDARVAAVERFFAGGPLDTRSNVQFGEGGAGTFSDGKLTTRISDPRCRFVLRAFAEFGAPQEILRQAKPHIGTDRLREVVKNIREEIVRCGGEVRFLSQLTGLRFLGGELYAAQTGEGEIPAKALVLALGHSARDSFQMLLRQGAKMEPKAFSVGMRIEHLRASVDTALYGRYAGHPKLPPGEYQLSLRRGERAAYTFCMCPGGVVVPSASEEGGVVVNGMSTYARDGQNSNSALCCSVTPEDFGQGVLDGIAFQRRLEQAAFRLGGGGYRAPMQTVGRFLAGKPGAELRRIAPSYAIGVSEADFSALYPAFVREMLCDGLRAFGRRQPGFDCPDAVLTGVESRTSSPIRILRGEDLQSNLRGVYPCGEGAGYAGGILSAALDGLRTAQALMARFLPPKG